MPPPNTLPGEAAGGTGRGVGAGGGGVGVGVGDLGVRPGSGRRQGGQVHPQGHFRGREEVGDRHTHTRFELKKKRSVNYPTSVARDAF